MDDASREVACWKRLLGEDPRLAADPEVRAGLVLAEAARAAISEALRNMGGGAWGLAVEEAACNFLAA